MTESYPEIVGRFVGACQAEARTRERLVCELWKWNALHPDARCNVLPEARVVRLLWRLIGRTMALGTIPGTDHDEVRAAVAVADLARRRWREACDQAEADRQEALAREVARLRTRPSGRHSP